MSKMILINKDGEKLMDVDSKDCYPEDKDGNIMVHTSIYGYFIGKKYPKKEMIEKFKNTFIEKTTPMEETL
jgi:hypothetical protein